MFYEEFILHAEPDDPRAQYKTDELKIYYYLENFVEKSDPVDTISHEWLHGLFDWATEGATRKDDMIDADGEHFIMRLINFC